MHVTIVNIRVKPEHLGAFVDATLRNCSASVEEMGNLRFDLLQSADDPNAFILYEAYGSPEAAAAHKETPHYQAWREEVADFMAEPRRGDPYRGLFPAGG